MFKTSFSKYLAAFILTIFVSFVILSATITGLMRTYAFQDTEERLRKENNIIVDLIMENGVSGLESELSMIAEVIEPMVNLNSDYEVMIADKYGIPVLYTATDESTEHKSIEIDLNNEIGLPRIDFNQFDKTATQDGNIEYVYNGSIDKSAEKYTIFAQTVMNNGEIVMRVMTMASTTREHRFVSITQRVVMNSSLAVMIAAVVVAYFIAMRILQPLKKMTDAVRKFGKGDFSIRVEVSEKNREVAELSKAFNNMAESLESLDKMRNSFLANVSHDLRTPMTTISGFIDGINSGAIPPEKHEYYLGIISAEIHRLSRLVSQLLDISRLESGERKFDYSDFDIAEMARIILISFEQKIEDKKLDVEFDAEFDDMYARADKDAIYQVLYNLCHNAIKFADRGGKFRVSISKITDTKIKVSVYDKGQSISRDDVGMVFDRFYKTDKSRGLDKSGVGLGLYISKTIIDAHGETISVEAYDDGCEFWFTLKEGVQPQKRKV